jgi:uncharacterized protein DUF2652
MTNSLLFIPDISGYTQFVQNTEVEHSQHVISELLEVLINANNEDLKLAEIEGDALFFYKEGSILSREKLLAQIEHMFTAFYGHLKMLEKNRICPCNACATAPELQLKIIAHIGELRFLDVQDSHKPFGQAVIEAHRLLKNSIGSDNYTLISDSLSNAVGLPHDYFSRLFSFKKGNDSYDGIDIAYLFSEIDNENLKLVPFAQPESVELANESALSITKEFPISAETLLEFITNYTYRHEWIKEVDKFEYNVDEVTRIGTEHACVIGGKHLDFVTVTKNVLSGQLVYGELTSIPSVVNEFYQFYTITPISASSSVLDIDIAWKAGSLIKKLIISLFVKKIFKKNMKNAMQGLFDFVLRSKAA